jgi:hypothetical protein
MRILSQTASSSACERNWSTFALIHTKQRNRLAYDKLEMLVYCYYNMKLRLRDKIAEENVIIENDYIDLLHTTNEPLSNGNDPLEEWIMPAHLDDKDGNPDPRVAAHAADDGVDVDRVISEEVKNSNNNTDSDDAFGGIASPDNSSDDEDGGDSGNEEGGGGGRYESYDHGQSSFGGGMSPISGEQNFNHVTQDRDRGDRGAGYGADENFSYGRKERHVPSNQRDPSDVATIAVSFDSMSLGTEPSGTSNEYHDHECGGQFGYGEYGYNPYGEVHAQSGVYGYNQLEQVHDQSLISAHPYYPLIGETVRSSQEIYEYHIHNYTSNYMDRMTWFDYCIFLDGRASFQPARNSCYM